jgi:hypothetical protein
MFWSIVIIILIFAMIYYTYNLPTSQAGTSTNITKQTLPPAPVTSVAPPAPITPPTQVTTISGNPSTVPVVFIPPTPNILVRF